MEPRVGGRGRDLVVVGASAGGVEALPRLAGALPRGFDATVVMVQHLMPGAGGHLVEILQRSSALPVRWAEDGEPLERGVIYVAPSGIHTTVDQARVRLIGGARENHSRPAINRLFRSAAAHHGPHVIGVILTGMLDDGAAGLIAIKRAGGAALVQDPQDAAYPDMPLAAINAVTADRVLPLDALGAAMILLARERPPHAEIPQDIVLEATFDQATANPPESVGQLGPQTPIACPECGGPLWETGAPRARSFRCYLGHVASPASLLASKSLEIEHALWSAVRALQERANTLGRLAVDAARLGSTQVAIDYERRADDAQQEVERARGFLLEMQRVAIDA